MPSPDVSGGVPKNHEPTRASEIRRHFERHMAAQAPADEQRLLEAKRVHDRPDGPSMAGQRVGARVFRVVGCAMTREIDRDQPKTLPQWSVELA
jgi:hypothetical protein